MKLETRRVMPVVVIVIALIGLWWAWQMRGRNVYGAPRPYMDKLYVLQQMTASALRSPNDLATHLPVITEIGKMSQDVAGVFRGDPREQHAKFAALAGDLGKRGAALEQSWRSAKRDDARTAFADLTAACNACHQTIGGGPSIAP